jgi:hypothetical protein
MVRTTRREMSWLVRFVPEVGGRRWRLRCAKPVPLVDASQGLTGWLCSGLMPRTGFWLVPTMTVPSGVAIPSWGHRRGTPSLAAFVMVSPGENPNSSGVGGGSVYVAIFLKTPPWSRWLFAGVGGCAAFASPARAEEAGAAVPDGRGSQGGSLGKRCGDLAPRGWLVRRRFFTFLSFFCSFLDVISSGRHITCTSFVRVSLC